MRTQFVVPILLTVSVILTCQAAMSVAQIAKYEIESPLANWNVRNTVSQSVATSEKDTANQLSVVLEVRKILIDADNHEIPLKSFFKPNTFEVYMGSLPSIEKETEPESSRINRIPDSPDSTVSFASSSQSIRRSMPVMVAKLDDAGVRMLYAAVKGVANRIEQLPTVTCYSGQSAAVNDMSLRPFVVAVKPQVGDFAVAHQPVIQTIEDGTMMHLKPTLENGKVKLNANLAHSTVSAVETFTVSGKPEEGVAIQIPEQTVRKVAVSAVLEDGETLFLDPRLQIEVEQQEDSRLPFSKSKMVRKTKQVYFLMTSRVVFQLPEDALEGRVVVVPSEE